MAIHRTEMEETKMSDLQNSGASVTQTSVENFANQGKTIRKNMTEDESKTEGTKSANLVFVKTLGNPKAPDATSNNDGKQYYKVVGYVLKSTEAISVPTVRLLDKKYLKFTPEADRQIGANQEFTVNNIELGMLLSRREYSGQITGGDTKVVLSATRPKSKNNERQGTASEYIPCLKLFDAKSGASIKTNQELIATPSGEDGTSYTIKPGYEAFDVFIKNAVRGGGRRQVPREKGEQAKNLAAAFANLYSTTGGVQ